MKKGGFILVGVFASIAFIVNLIVGILILCGVLLEDVCNEAVNEMSEYDPYNNYNSFLALVCWDGANVYGIASIVDSGLWLVVAVLVFVFTCGNRFQQFQQKVQQEDEVTGDVTGLSPTGDVV